MEASLLTPRLVAIACALAACAYAGCESVPTLTFEHPDATAPDAESDDATPSADDAAADDASQGDDTADGVPGDTADAAGSADSDAAADSNSTSDSPVGCPVAPPPNASVCCGNVPCNLNCVPSQCALCQACEGGLCCGKPNSVVCKPAGAVCQ
jgi:hypothetical protein